MYRWLVVYTLKNGCKISGIYEGPEKDSLSAAQTLCNGIKPDMFISHFGIDKTHMIGVRFGEIAAMDISVYKE